MAGEDKKQFEKPSTYLLLFNKYSKIIVTLLTIFVLFLGYYLLLQPKIIIIQSTRGDILPEVERKEVELKELVEKVKRLRTKYNSIKNERTTDLTKLYTVIPSDPDIANIFLKADRLANEYGFQLLALDIAEPSKKIIKSKKGVKEVKKVPFESLIIHMVLAQVDDRNNGYQSFKEYLGGLENSLRLMDIETVSFETFIASEESYPTFNFSITTYFNKEKDEKDQ